MQEFWVALAGPAVNVVIVADLFAFLVGLSSVQRVFQVELMRGSFLVHGSGLAFIEILARNDRNDVPFWIIIEAVCARNARRKSSSEQVLRKLWLIPVNSGQFSLGTQFALARTALD